MKFGRILTGLFLVLITPHFSKAQAPCVYLGADISPGAGLGNPAQFTEYLGDLFFSASGASVGTELWRWDGTDATLVEDIRPGLFSSNPQDFIVYDGELYFAANDGTVGTELFRYDGTSVSMVADINPGVGHAYPGKFIEYSGDLYFTADNGTNGNELWVWDGTSVSMVMDINPGAPGSGITEIVQFGVELVFNANDGTNGLEPWMFDGSTPTMLMDVRPGFNGCEVQDLTPFGGETIFRANNGTNGMELWAYDGTSVYMIMDINPGIMNGNPWEITVSGSYVYFRALDGVNGYELWQYDGTTPVLLEDIYVGGPHPISSVPANLTDVDGTLYFNANNGTDGIELYKHDGTTMTYLDVNPGPGDSDPANFIGIGSDVYFACNDGTDGMEIYHWDGTTLTLGEDIEPGAGGSSPMWLTWYEGDIVFNAGNSFVSNELWVWPIDAVLESEITVVTCGEYVAPSGAVYTDLGTYEVEDVIPSELYPLCDSLITINLTIGESNSDFDYGETTFCSNNEDLLPVSIAEPGGTFSSTPSGLIMSSSSGELYFDISDPGTYAIQYITPGFCPDTSVVDITMNPAVDASFTYANSLYCLSDDDPSPMDVETAGGEWSVTPAGLVVNASNGTVDLSASTEGVYTIKHVTSGTCPDSVEFEMTVVNMTTTVNVSAPTLTAVETGALYQWMKCDDEFGLLPIWEANEISYTGPTNGCYAVELTAGECIDTSECHCFIYYNLDENELGAEVDLFPNPVLNELTIQLDKTLDLSLVITDETGRVVYQDQFNEAQQTIDLEYLSSGVYFLMLYNQEGAFIEKLIKE